MLFLLFFTQFRNSFTKPKKKIFYKKIIHYKLVISKKKRNAGFLHAKMVARCIVISHQNIIYSHIHDNVMMLCNSKLCQTGEQYACQLFGFFLLNVKGKKNIQKVSENIFSNRIYYPKILPLPTCLVSLYCDQC